MHAKLDAPEGELTDSMRMFRLGLEGGRPASGAIGVQPEWFYKGDGSWLAAPEQPLSYPSFALDGGEEPELAGLYVIGDDGEPPAPASPSATSIPTTYSSGRITSISPTPNCAPPPSGLKS